MKNTMNIATALQDCLSYNNRFATAKLTAEQIGAENLKTWTTLIKGLHMAAYSVYALCENSDLSVESKSVDKSQLYDRIRGILVELGEVNGRVLKANEELATLIVGYAGKRGNQDSPELQLCLSKIRNNKKLQEEYAKLNGVNPETLTKLEEELKELEEEKNTLLENPDNRIKVPTRNTESTFRLEVEHRLARVIADQQAKSWEDLQAEAEAKKKARKAAKKAKKSAK